MDGLPFFQYVDGHFFLLFFHFLPRFRTSAATQNESIQFSHTANSHPAPVRPLWRRSRDKFSGLRRYWKYSPRRKIARKFGKAAPDCACVSGIMIVWRFLFLCRLTICWMRFVGNVCRSKFDCLEFVLIIWEIRCWILLIFNLRRFGF